MGRNDHKKEIKALITGIKGVLTELEGKKEYFEESIKRIETDQSLYAEKREAFFGGINGDIHVEDVQQEVRNVYFLKLLVDWHAKSENLQVDVEDYIDNLSESRAEDMTTVYDDLDTVVEILDTDACMYESVDELVGQLTSAVDMLEGML